MAYDDYGDETYEDEISGDEEPTAKPGWLQETPFWAISAILHLVLIFILVAFRSLDGGPQDESKIPIVMKRQTKKPPPYDPTKKRDIKRTPKILDPKKVKKPIIKRKIDEVTTEIPKGTDLRNVSNFNLDARSINTAIGVGGGAAGAYGNRYGKGSLKREGGSDGTESAVRAALEWLRRHQSPDGSWKCHDFIKKCKKICRNVNAERYGDGRGFAEHDVGVTALAMLAFTGYGQTHRDGDHPEYVECLRKA
ncbi:MAG: hypothetical protein O7J95_17350, partial [Planctomycetota bacterium]|nr:hypothetical protein [Planctomycetota bacterium]